MTSPPPRSPPAQPTRGSGPHTFTVTATSKDGLTGTADVTYEVVPATSASGIGPSPAAPNPPVPGPATLPFTGSRTVLGALLSLFLVTLGAGLVRLSRRGTRRPRP